MENMMKRCAGAVVAALAMCLALAVPSAWADSVSDEVLLAPVEGAHDVSVSIKSKEADVTAESLALDVAVVGEGAADVTVGFTFSDALVGAKVKEFTTDENGRMNIYVAGGENLFKDGTLALGRVVPTAKEGAKVSAKMKVEVPEGDGVLQFVRMGGARVYDLEPSTTLYRPEAVTVDLAALPSVPDPTPTPDDKGPNNDIIGQTPDTNPNKELPATGDGLVPIIVGLVCVAAVAAVVIVALVVRKKKADKQ